MGEYYRPVFEDMARLDKFDLIVEILEDVIIPNMPAYHVMWMDLVGFGYNKAKKYLKSAEWCEKVIAMSTDAQIKTATRFNLAKNYTAANYPEKSKQNLDIILKLDPKNTDAKLELSVALFAMNKKKESRELLYSLIEETKGTDNEKVVIFNTGISLIADGKFQEGMKALGIGREMKIWGAHTHKFPIPQWKGEYVPGKSIMLIGEGGIGDEIINARFAKHFRDKGMIPHIASCHKLDTIFARMPFESARNYVKFTTDIADISKFDYWAPMMDLPVLMNIEAKDLWYGPYLSTDIEHDKKWKQLIGNTGKLKIGLKWSGNPLYEHDLHRSLPIKDIVAALGDKFELYSLQKDVDREVLQDLPQVHDLHDHLETYEDALSAMNQMDLIITSCTSIAHAAAALGKRTIVMPPIMTYYVWAEEGKNSWYGDNLSILIQEDVRRWDKPIARMKEIVEKEF